MSAVDLIQELWARLDAEGKWPLVIRVHKVDIRTLLDTLTAKVTALAEWKAMHGRVVEGFMEVCEAVDVQFDAPEAVAYAINARINNAEHDKRAAEAALAEMRVELEQAEGARDHYLSNWKEAADELETARKALEIGRQLANAAFNIHQRGAVDERALQSLKQVQVAWDEALLSPARAQSKPSDDLSGVGK